MNLRQKNKRLKRDNRLMKDIIENSPSMQELYDRYNKPLNITTTTMRFKKYISRRCSSPYEQTDPALLKEEVTRDILEGVKKHIIYETYPNGYTMMPEIVASIYIGVGDDYS